MLVGFVASFCCLLYFASKSKIAVLTHQQTQSGSHLNQRFVQSNPNLGSSGWPVPAPNRRQRELTVGQGGGQTLTAPPPWAATPPFVSSPLCPVLLPHPLSPSPCPEKPPCWLGSGSVGAASLLPLWCCWAGRSPRVNPAHLGCPHWQQPWADTSGLSWPGTYLGIHPESPFVAIAHWAPLIPISNRYGPNSCALDEHLLAVGTQAF